MRTIPAAELERILNGTGNWLFRVEMRRPGESAWTNLSDGPHGDWAVGIETSGDTPDAPAAEFTLRFVPRDGADGTSPGLSQSALNRVANQFRPLVYPGRQVRVLAANVADGGSPVWRQWKRLEVEESGVRSGEVWARCLTLDAKLDATIMTIEEDGGAPAPGLPVEDEIENILTQWSPWALPLRVIGTPGWNVGEYPRGRISVGQLVRQLAKRNGWDIRFSYSEADGDERLTLSLPPRDKTEPDLYLTASQVVEVPDFSTSRRDVRNDFALDYIDASGERQTATRQNGTEDPPTGSIGEFGRRAMVLDRTEEGSPIRTASQANALLAYADHDLSDLLSARRVVLPFNPWIELHDVLEIPADGEQYDFPSLWAVTRPSHRVDALDGPETVLDLRAGSPVGAYYAWDERGPSTPTPSFAIHYAEDSDGTGASSTFDPERHLYARTSDDGGATWSDWTPIRNVPEFGLVNFREVGASQPGYRRWQWDRVGMAVAEVWWAYHKYPAPWSDDNWADVATRVVPLPEGQNWIEVPGDVSAAEIGALWVEPRLPDLTVFDDYVIERAQLYPETPQVNPWISAEYADGVVNVYAGADPTDSALPIAWEIRQGPDAEILLASGTWQTAAAASEGSAVLNQMPPEAGRRTYWLKVVDVTGAESWTSTGVENPARRIGDGALDRIAAFAASFAPIQRVSAKPAEGTREGERIFLWNTNSPDHKTIWRWEGGDWVLDTEADQSIIYPGAVVAHSITAVEMSTIDLAVEQYIGSHNYVEGEEGWIIRGDGSGEFNHVLIRGDSIFEGIVALERSSANNKISFRAGGVEFGDISAELYPGPVGQIVSAMRFSVGDEDRISITHGSLVVPAIHLHEQTRVDGLLTAAAGLRSEGDTILGTTSSGPPGSEGYFEVRNDGAPSSQGHTNIYAIAYWNGELRQFHMRLDADRRAEWVEV